MIKLISNFPPRLLSSFLLFINLSKNIIFDLLNCIISRYNSYVDPINMIKTDLELPYTISFFQLSQELPYNNVFFFFNLFRKSIIRNILNLVALPWWRTKVNYGALQIYYGPLPHYYGALPLYYGALPLFYNSSDIFQ